MSPNQSRYNFKINKMHKSGHWRKSETQNLGIFYFFATFLAPKPLKGFMRGNKTDDNIELDVWEDKYDISFKDQIIF